MVFVSDVKGGRPVVRSAGTEDVQQEGHDGHATCQSSLSHLSHAHRHPGTASRFYAPHMLNMLNMVNPQTRFIGVFTGGVFTGGVFTGGAPGRIRTRDLRVVSRRATKLPGCSTPTSHAEKALRFAQGGADFGRCGERVRRGANACCDNGVSLPGPA